MKQLAAILLALALLPAAAADPPGRVGRLAWIEGEALTYTDADAGWEGARINTHLTSENSVWTQPRSRAEVRAGSIALRLEEASQLDIARLDDFELHAHLARGSLSVRVRYFEKGESIFVTTPQARFQVRGNGRFRIDSDADRGESRLTVFAGTARLEGSGGAVIVDTGRTVVVTGGERPQYQFETAVTTGIDEWALARDERFAEGQASRYVSPRMTGWEDLDQYGEWRSEPEYGTVWYPSRVEVGWAPYRHGRWAHERPWGWTWVDDAPWGYAPFHYGRWVYVRNRWGWYPGRYDPRPVWAPALVGWVGGAGWSLTINSGPVGVVGWYPLSPWERYEPWYRVQPTYVTHVNRVVIVDRDPPRGGGHYRDHATVATRDVFGSRRPVRDSMQNVPRDVVARQPVASGTAVLPPTNVVRSRPGAVSPGTAPSQGTPSAVSPGRPAGSQPPLPGQATPNVIAPAPPAVNPGRPAGSQPPLPGQATPNVIAPPPSSGRFNTRPGDALPASPTPPGALPTPVPQTAPPVTNAPARPAFTNRPPQQVPMESSRPAMPALPAAPANPASPAMPAAPATPYVPRMPSRLEPQQAAPSAVAPRPAEPARPVEAPVYRQPRGAPPETPRARPEAPRDARPANPESAPPPVAKPVEKPAQSTRGPKEDKPAKEDKPPKESGQRER
jgi:hypothetical protein